MTCSEHNVEELKHASPKYQHKDEDYNQDCDPTPDNSPQLIKQLELNDPVCGLKLDKNKRELLGSHLYKWNRLDISMEILCSHKIISFVWFFSLGNSNLVSCNDIPGVFHELQ